MRKILFRGKRTDNDKWVYGSPLFQDGYVLIRFWNSEEFEWEEYLVAPKSISEFTGLTDKNGKKIFEGDVVWTDKFGSPNKRYIIIFDSQLGAFIGQNKYNRFFVAFDGNGDQFEVIGNVHDNPELLEGGEQECSSV